MTTNDILILTCSGSGGLEAAVVNHLSPGDAVLAVSIGSFGDRFARIAEVYGARVTRHEVEWGRAADPLEVGARLRAMAAAGRPARAVLLTHNETSTGIENPLARLAEATHSAEPDALILVDGISGLGAVPFETDAWGLDVVATASQKSWMSPPGLAMISVSERAWQAAGQATMPRFYFDLTEARKFRATGETPWTPAIGVLFALDVALDMLEREGYPQVFARHAACAAAARAGLRVLGLRLVAENSDASQTVTAAWLPEGIEWTLLNRAMLSRGLALAGGQERMAGRILRVGHLGSASVEDVVSAVATVAESLAELGHEVDLEAAVEAANVAAARSRETTPSLEPAVARGA